MRIGQLAGLAGVDTETIRFYEQQGVLPPPDRQAGNRLSHLHEDTRGAAGVHPPMPDPEPLTGGDLRTAALSGQPPSSRVTPSTPCWTTTLLMSGLR